MSDGQPVRFFNRHSGQLEVEQVYGEGALRWAYESATGRLSLPLLARSPLFSRWYGWRMRRPASRARVAPFVEAYRVRMDDFVTPDGGFASFDDFFSRRLRPGARPVDPDPGAAVFPADGRHLAVPGIGEAGRFFVKGQRFDLAALFGDAATAARFTGGTLVLSRLCPVDYHRFHFPCGGTATASVPLDGPLYSVNPIALRRRIASLWENKRYRTLLRNEAFGEVAMFEVGATCVGSVIQTAALPGEAAKGAEKGYFAFGGSAVLTVFQPGTFAPAADLLEHSADGVEVYAHTGERMGIAG